MKKLVLMFVAIAAISFAVRSYRSYLFRILW